MSTDFRAVLLAAEVREIERRYTSQATRPGLMDRAGLAAAELARLLVGEKDRRIAIVAGPGNNGGDALVAARYLKQWWFDVVLIYAGDDTKMPADARTALSAWLQAGGRCVDSPGAIGRTGLVVDGLFGIGLQRPLEGKLAALVGWINGCGSPVLSLDVPSGLDSNTGTVHGNAVHAHHTLTYIGLKPGLLTLEGPDLAGEVHVETLGVEMPFPRTGGWLIDSSVLVGVLPPRPRNTHKGSYGTVGIIGGAAGMAGAALLAGRAALRLGAGKVRVGLLADAPSLDPAQPELMLTPAQELLAMKGLDCLACGPGLGQSQAAGHALAVVLERSVPLVLDADALNLVAANEPLQKSLQRRNAPTLLTPHPAEAGRLLGCATADVQSDRVRSACELARRFHASVVLKGNGSICASPDGNWHVNTSGNPGMASAGMGDVLTGIIAAFLAQGATARLALLAGVHLHGLAADRLVRQDVGPVGITASEVIDAARATLNAPPRSLSRPGS